jgi:hypothetical protein
MSHEPSSNRKRKAVKESVIAINSDDRNRKKNKSPTANYTQQDHEDVGTKARVESIKGLNQSGSSAVTVAISTKPKTSDRLKLISILCKVSVLPYDKKPGAKMSKLGRSSRRRRRLRKRTIWTRDKKPGAKKPRSR